MNIMRKRMLGPVLLATLVMTSGLAPGQTTRTKIEVPVGTRILVRMVDSLDSSKQQAGYRFTASLETNLQVDDTVVAPRGTTVHGRLANAEEAGRMSGGAELTLELTDIVINSTSFPLFNNSFFLTSKSKSHKKAGKRLC